MTEESAHLTSNSSMLVQGMLSFLKLRYGLQGRDRPSSNAGVSSETDV